jgi:predicted dehydrogenase
MATSSPTLANVRLGIVGCGEHSHVHAAAARAVPGVEIVACCDIDAAKAEAWAQQHGCHGWHRDLSHLLDQARLDGVILCTWPNQHTEQVRLCLSAGITNILCEKALVTSAAEARTTWELVRAQGANLMEGSMYRHHPAIRKLERILSYGDIGPVDSVRAVFHNYEPEDRTASGHADNWRNRSDRGGGVPYDWMHYLVDSCNHFSGSRPRRVFASGSSSPERGVIYRIYGLIEYESGLVGIIENSKTASFSNMLQINCAHGILHLPVAWGILGESKITQTHRKPPWGYILSDTYEIAEANAFVLQLDNFCQVVRGTAAPLVPLTDSITNAMTTEALVASLREQRAVDVDLSGL